MRLSQQLAPLTCVEHLGEQAAHQTGVEVGVGEQQRQARVARLAQPQPLLAALVHTVAAQHALKQLRWAHTHTNTQHTHTVRHRYVKAQIC